MEIGGRLRVTRDDRVIGELVAGHIVGSALLLSGVTADVDAVVVEPVRYMRWEVEALDRYLAANPETRMVLQKYLARDLATKVLGATKLSAHTGTVHECCEIAISQEIRLPAMTPAIDCIIRCDPSQGGP